VDRGRAYADILLDRALREGGFPEPRDRALLTELVMGTLRRRGALDFTLSPHLSRPLEKTDALVRNALRLGAYQLLYTRIPERVAIFETVAAVKSVRGRSLRGWSTRCCGRWSVREDAAPPSGEGPLRKSVELSVPLPLLHALLRSLGEPETYSFLESSLEKPPFAVRANPFRASRDALAARLAEAGMEPAPCRYASDGLLLGKPGKVHADPGFRSGEYLMMDEGAQLIAPLLSPREGEEVLDACAAPGGKATHLSALSFGKARILAADVSEGRVKMLKETVARLGAKGVATAVHDFSAEPLPGANRFDKISWTRRAPGWGSSGAIPTRSGGSIPATSVAWRPFSAPSCEAPGNR
jgi:16S rRNA (cytosine967-C5)-methyltransferase